MQSVPVTPRAPEREQQPRPPNGRTGLWLFLALSLVAVLAAGVVVVLLSGDDETADPTTTAPEEVVPTTDGPDPVTSGDPDPTSATSASTEPTTAPEPILENGRHAAWAIGIDVEARTFEFDVIQFLTGEEALAAYLDREPDPHPEGPPNGYYIVNDNPRLRVLPVAEGVSVSILDPANSYVPAEVDFADLETHFLENQLADGSGHLSQFPYWLAVDGDVIVDMGEQFIP